MHPQAEACDGTSLAGPMGVPPGSFGTKSTSADAAWRRQRDLFFVDEARKTTRTMMGLGVVVQLSTFGVLIDAGYPSWRICTLAGLYLMFFLTHKLIVGLEMDSNRVASSFIRMSVASQLFVVGSAALTGGVHSPFLPGTVLPAIVSLLFFGPQAVSRWVALGNALLIVAMVSLPTEVTGPALPNTHYTIGILISLTIQFFFLWTVNRTLKEVAGPNREISTGAVWATLVLNLIPSARSWRIHSRCCSRSEETRTLSRS